MSYIARRTSINGTPMLVKLPPENSLDYRNTGEGGMAFFLIVKQLYRPKSRQVCMAGYIEFPKQNCLIRPRHLDRDNIIDAGLLIGSTGRSLWDDEKEKYFTPTINDLTPEGKRLYHTLKRLYGDVTIVTLLDT